MEEILSNCKDSHLRGSYYQSDNITIHMYYVYILSSISRVLYAGVTNNLYSRVKQHKSAEDPKAFTARYMVNRLVYFEKYRSRQKAIEREKQIKKWRREKKIRLIETVNPEFIA